MFESLSFRKWNSIWQWYEEDDEESIAVSPSRKRIWDEQACLWWWPVWTWRQRGSRWKSWSPSWEQSASLRSRATSGKSSHYSLFIFIVEMNIDQPGHRPMYWSRQGMVSLCINTRVFWNRPLKRLTRSLFLRGCIVYDRTDPKKGIWDMCGLWIWITSYHTGGPHSWSKKSSQKLRKSLGDWQRRKTSTTRRRMCA